MSTVRFGLPFNDVIPLWHPGEDITWHRTLDADLRDVLGLGLVAPSPGPASAGAWREEIETATLTGSALELLPAQPTGKRAQGADGAGAVVTISEELTIAQAMEGGLDTSSMGIHVARMMLRSARDSAILLFTLRAPRDPEAHHLLSIPSEVDEQGVLHFHLGTLMEMEGGSWEGAARQDGMTMLDLDVPYEDLLDGESLDASAMEGLSAPVMECILKPGFPFALGYSFMVQQ